jgi:anti-anti-sigma factor
MDTQQAPFTATTPSIGLAGVLGVGNAAPLDVLVGAKLRDGVCDVVLEMSKVTHVDSTGIAMLLGARSLVRAAGGRLLLVGVCPHVLKVLIVTRLLSFFEIRPAMAAA